MQTIQSTTRDDRPSVAVPQISVCVPAYNYGRFLTAAIESVLAQTYQDWELIVCDNASTDETQEVLRGWTDRRIRVYRNASAVPMVHNFNRCLDLARGEFVLILCADDMLAPDALERLMNALQAHPSAALALACQRQDVDETGNPVELVRAHRLGPGFVSGRDVLIAQCQGPVIIGVPTQVLARTAVIREAGGFDPKAGHCIDNDLYCRICEQWDVVFVENALFYYRLHGSMGTVGDYQNLKDIESDHFMFQRLFRESSVLSSNRSYRREFVKRRLYLWFHRAVDEARSGRIRRAGWILSRIGSFEPVPWWLPYYGYRYSRYLCARQVKSWLERRITASECPAVGDSKPPDA